MVLLDECHTLCQSLTKNRSEADNMLANGYTRVWDCGQLVYEMTT
jgi:hypothetical protein